MGGVGALLRKCVMLLYSFVPLKMRATGTRYSNNIKQHLNIHY